MPFRLFSCPDLLRQFKSLVALAASRRTSSCNRDAFRPQIRQKARGLRGDIGAHVPGVGAVISSR